MRTSVCVSLRHGVPARVVLSGGFGPSQTGGVRELAIEAKDLRGFIKAMDWRSCRAGRAAGRAAAP